MKPATTVLTMSIKRDEAEILKKYFAERGWITSKVLHAALDMFLEQELEEQELYYERWDAESKKPIKIL